MNTVKGGFIWYKKPEVYGAWVNIFGNTAILLNDIDLVAVVGCHFRGFPTWDMQMPPPMKSFLHQYNLAGKTVIPFNTYAEYVVGADLIR